MILDRPAIEKLIPHRDPFCFVDRILEIDEAHVVGEKDFTGEEWFFNGHFPGQPVLPGVLIVEALTQAAACLVHAHPAFRGKTFFLAKLEDFRFRTIVSPPRTLSLEVTLLKLRGPVARLAGTAKVSGAIAAEGSFTAALQE